MASLKHLCYVFWFFNRFITRLLDKYQLLGQKYTNICLNDLFADVENCSTNFLHDMAS